jgi:MFS family permease
MVFVVPIALLSDRLGTRKKVLLVATVLIASGIGLLSVASGPLVWVAVSMAGMVRDGFMAVFMTAIIESEGVGAAYAGTATGMTMVFSGIGSLVAPPLGNSLAAINPGLPFIFWSALTGLGFIGLLAASERKAVPVPRLEEVV